MTVRDATLQLMRRLGMTTIFGNPGSTEVPFLTRPDAVIDGVADLLERL